ncbi:hypothetical protein CIG19_13575 [Enterobacterales bacterium CwR94]|nr:hypothetical protein CIG19_13575 [Enterobacterales bacterium CwR94]
MSYLKRDDRTEMLLNATTEIMRQQGFVATTARRIAQQSNSAIGNINRVFGSLQALKELAFITLTQQVVVEFKQRALQMAPREAMLIMLGDPVECHELIEVHLWQEVAILAEQDASLTPIYTEALRVWHQALCDTINDGVAQQAFRCSDTVEQTAWRLMACALGLDMLVRFGPLQPAQDEARRSVLRMIDFELNTAEFPD